MSTQDIQIVIITGREGGVNCRTAIKALFLNFNLCRSVMWDSYSCSFTSISFLLITYIRSEIILTKLCNLIGLFDCQVTHRYYSNAI